MTDQRIQEITARCEAAKEWAAGCDRTSRGCQIPQISKVLNEDVPWLLTLLAAKDAEIERLQYKLDELIGLFPICDGCDGKIDGAKTDKCNDDFCSAKCIDRAVELGKEFERLRERLGATENDLVNASMNLEYMAQLVENDQWIPASKPPEGCGTYRIWAKSKEWSPFERTDHYNSVTGKWGHEAMGWGEVTHWRPLPAAPEEGADHGA